MQGPSLVKLKLDGCLIDFVITCYFCLISDGYAGDHIFSFDSYHAFPYFDQPDDALYTIACESDLLPMTVNFGLSQIWIFTILMENLFRQTWLRSL